MVCTDTIWYRIYGICFWYILGGPRVVWRTNVLYIFYTVAHIWYRVYGIYCIWCIVLEV